MSLIICPECQHEVSAKAPTCPHCGVKIADNIKRCPVCNTYVLMAAQQCPNCKTKFVINTSNEESPADTKQQDETDVQAAKKAETVAKEPPVSPATPQKKSSSAPLWLLILGILVIAIGGFFYWENQNQEKEEEQAFILLENCNNPLNFEDFIARFPNSPHIYNVRARLQELREEDSLWLEISRKEDMNILQKFVDEHPHSLYKKAALQKIDSIDWKMARLIDKKYAYEAYIKRHENGEFLNEAFSALEAARAREERARRDSIAAAADSALIPSL